MTDTETTEATPEAPARLAVDERTGIITIREDTTTWVLKPPKLGGLRAVDEYLARCNAEQVEREATLATARDAATDDEPFVAPAPWEERAFARAQNYGFWVVAFDVCGAGTAPSFDDAPDWFGLLEPISDILALWHQSPTRAPGAMPGAVLRQVAGISANGGR